MRDIEQTPQEKFRTDSLWAAAQCLCTGQSIDVGTVTSRQEINDFYQQHSRGENGSSTHRLLSGWRYEALGKTLVQLLQGNANIKLSWPNQSLHAHVSN